LAKLVLRRLLDVLPLLFVASVVAFSLQAIAPGDPAQKIATVSGAGQEPDPSQVAALHVELGLDRPLLERYFLWLGRVARLDLGISYLNKRPVATLLGERLPASLALAAVSLAAAVLISVPLGILAAVRRGSPLDELIRPVTLLGASLPAFWVALLLIWLFAARLRWLPALGSPTPEGIVLPAAVMTVRSLGLLTRLTRATTLDALTLPHVVVARAKGLLWRQVVVRHILANSWGPIITAVALDFAAFVTNAAVVEWVFAWPGIGRAGVEAALTGDVPMLLGFVLCAALVVVIANLAADIGIAASDPRLRRL
jgi:ABC-type dipeptide/oligopeptide/nickel transport system permease component